MCYRLTVCDVCTDWRSAQIRRRVATLRLHEPTIWANFRHAYFCRIVFPHFGFVRTQRLMTRIPHGSSQIEAYVTMSVCSLLISMRKNIRICGERERAGDRSGMEKLVSVLQNGKAIVRAFSAKIQQLNVIAAVTLHCRTAGTSPTGCSMPSRQQRRTCCCRRNVPTTFAYFRHQY